LVWPSNDKPAGIIKMTSRIQDSLFGAVLLVIAGSWTWLVIKTIPPGFGDGEIGPRAFPLAFGIILLMLAALLLAWPLFTRTRDRSESEAPDAPLAEPAPLYWLPALTVLIEILIYGFLLEKIGFVLATPVIVLLVMVVSLRERSVSKLIGTALGLSVGCWLIFEKVMGIYLAKGSWLNLG